MGAQSTVITFDLLRSLSSGSISSSYAAVGSAFTYPCRIIKIVNNTTEDVTVSIDGVHDYDYIPAGGFSLYDAGTNRGNSSPEMCFSKGTQIFVKGTSGTGSVYVVCLYANIPQPSYPEM